MFRKNTFSVLFLAVAAGLSSNSVVRAQQSSMLGLSQYLQPNGGYQSGPRLMMPNGCGSDTSFFNAQRVPQSVGGADFSGPCNTHDLCYGTFGASKHDCDLNFLLNLHQECWTGSIAINHVPPCLGVANLYFSAVAIGGGPAYRQGQLQAIGPSPFQPSLLGPAPSLSERFSLLPKEQSFEPPPLGNPFPIPPFGNQ